MKIALPLAVVAFGAAGMIGFGRRSHPPAATSAAAAASSAPTAADRIHERAGLEQDIKKNPGHVPILLRLAELEREDGHPDKAALHLREVLTQEPGREDARLELGRALYEANDFDGALKETERLVKDHPGSVDGLYNLGAMHANAGRIDSAREIWTRAVAAGPGTESGRRAKDALAKVSGASNPALPPGHPQIGDAPAANTPASSAPAGSSIDPKTAELLSDMIRRK
ncbi:MAG: tetratricopeptide repeat protein [Bryobacteraceae bacterium]